MFLLRTSWFFGILFLLSAATSSKDVKRKPFPVFPKNERSYNTGGSSYAAENTVTTYASHPVAGSSYGTSGSSASVEPYAAASNVVGAADAAAAAAASSAAAAAANAAASGSYGSYAPVAAAGAAAAASGSYGSYTPVAAASGGYDSTYNNAGSSYGSGSTYSDGYDTHGTSYSAGASYTAASSYGAGAGSYGAGSYGHGSGAYGAGSYGGGGSTYSVSYPSGGGYSKGAFGPDTLSFLSSLAPSLLLSGLLLPLALSSLLAASNTTLFGRKRREVEEESMDFFDEEELAQLDDWDSDGSAVLKIVKALDDVMDSNGEKDKMVDNMADFLQDKGLLKPDNECLEKMACLDASDEKADNSLASRLNKVLKALERNEKLPKDFKKRLTAAKTKRDNCSSFNCEGILI